jgi:hypothetical protein
MIAAGDPSVKQLRALCTTRRSSGSFLAIDGEMPVGNMWRLTDTRINSSEAATVIAAICEHLLAASVEWVVPFAARDLSISLDGDVLIEPRPSLPPEPVIEVVTRLLAELVDLVDDPEPVLEAFAGMANQGSLPPFSELAELADWMEQAFDLRDSRAVLRPIAERMAFAAGPAAIPPVVVPVPEAIDWADLPLEKSHAVEEVAPRAHAAPRIATAVVLVAIGVIAISLVERTRRDSTDRASQPPAARAERTSSGATNPSEPTAPTTERVAGPASTASQAASPKTAKEPQSTNSRAPDQFVADKSRTVALETPGILAPVFSPSFDASGSAMFFHVGRGPQTQLVEGRLDSGEQLVEVRAFASDGSRNYHARLSPDGTHVAFDSDRDGERGVYIARRDGSMTRKVSGPGFAAVPTWSPTGTQLAFVRGEPSRRSVWNLWLLDVGSDTLERVTSYRYGQLWGASWFPDEKRVAYSHEASLYVFDLKSGAQERFDSPVRGQMVRTPAVSPEGRRIVFQVHGDGVWMLELDDRSMRRILDDPTAEEFTWDSRGARVAYHSRRDGRWRIWITAPPPPSDPTP